MKISKLKFLGCGLTATFASLLTICSIGYSIADQFRGTVDGALGTKSYQTDTSNAKYVSTYKSGEDLMNAAKLLAREQGQEGTVIMKNDNDVLPLKAGSTIALMGGASYEPYMTGSGNVDKVKLLDALKSEGFKVNSTLETIYDNILKVTHKEPSGMPWGPAEIEVKDYAPNTSAGDYTNFKIIEANPDSFFISKGGASSTWKDESKSDVAIVTFSRPGGEGTTYKPNSALDMDENPTGKNPLALSTDELAVVKAAKEVAQKVVVLLNTSCTIEIDPLTHGDYQVDGIAYIGIPNDYQFKGIVDVLAGKVNSTGALADTYAVLSTSSPALENFGGQYYSDYQTISRTKGQDPRWSDKDIGNEIAGSFGGGSATYNGGYFVNEVEGIYTGYNYYETRYYDSIVNPSYKANSLKGSSTNTGWDYSKEVNYTFGHGLSYLPYTQKLDSVSVEKKVDGKIKARISITNNSTKDGKFLAQLYVQTPYTEYDRTNKVEKSAIQFLNCKKVNVKAGKTESVEIEIPTKYIASYDYTKAKTYILDGGKYYFSTGAGAHVALNNIIKKQGKGSEGNENCTFVWDNGNESNTDTSTFSVSESGAQITNVADDVNLNYYLPDSTTYLSRSDWEGTYPINYGSKDHPITIASSLKKDEWIKQLRNEQYTIKSDDPIKNVNGNATSGVDFSTIGGDQQTNIENPMWDQIVDGIPLDQAVGAVAHGGSQSDVLKNVNNPIVKQYDGPCGFNGQKLSANNGESVEKDRYYVDPESEAGKFMPCINSQTLQGSSFNPDLSLEWGRILGNSGLYMSMFQIWAGALNYHRCPYNGRNVEYLSEDPMLSNVLGEKLIEGTKEFGIIVGPKHIGFNDQEHNRAGISVYMNEQKFRETDLRAFQGSAEEGKCLGFMVAFNRIGAINASHHVGMIKRLIRGEWGFKGLISTDMMTNALYFNPEGCIMASVTQMADFGGDNSTLGGDNGKDATWPYLSVSSLKNDNTLYTAAKQCMKYQLYAFANSAILNISTTRVTPFWESTLVTLIVVTAILTVLSACLLVLTLLPSKKEE